MISSGNRYTVSGRQVVQTTAQYESFGLRQMINIISGYLISLLFEMTSSEPYIKHTNEMSGVFICEQVS